MTLKKSPKSSILCDGSKSILYFHHARIPLTFWRYIVLGDINLVNIIEDWDVLEEYAGEKLGFYRLLANNGKSEIES